MATFVGTNGNNDIEGTSVADLIYGRAGNDELEGGAGSDRIWGEIGNDEIDGDTGNDILYGGLGRDHIDGGVGMDQLYGGLGADVFEFDREDQGIDRVRDWADGQDRLDVEDFDFTLSQALATGRQRGDDVVFTFDPTTIVVVEDAHLAQFTAQDFIL